MKVRALATQVARELRRSQTESETVFWELVRRKQCADKKFYRQYPMVFEYEKERNYRFFIADFYCRESKLVVEIDGGIHETQKDYDSYRTFLMNQMGMKVIRFSNKEVLESPQKVFIKLQKSLT